MDTNITLDEVRIMLGQRDMLIYTLEREVRRLTEESINLADRLAKAGEKNDASQ